MKRRRNTGEFLLLCLLMLTLGCLYTWSYLAVLLEDTLQWNSGMTADIFTCSIIFYSVGNIAGGILSKRVRGRMIFLISAISILTGLWCASDVRSYRTILGFYGVLYSLGVGLAYNAGMSLAKRHLGQNMGTGMGILLFANGWTRSLFKLTVGETKLPLGFLWVLILAVIMSIVLNKTRTGRYIIAIGSNKEATRLSGINVARYQTMAYIFSGIFTGLGALAYSSAFQSMAPGGGAGVELNAIGGAIIGGTSMSGGSGSISGTILGVFIMSVLQTGLPLIGLQANYQQIIIGLVLIVAVYIDVLKNKRLNK